MIMARFPKQSTLIMSNDFLSVLVIYLDTVDVIVCKYET